MATTCRRCDYSLTAKVRFCPSCGAPQDKTDADSPQRFAEERIELLCRYLPKNLVKHLMTERRAPLGQLAVAAVVFADISGFTAMSEKMDPEQVLKVMNGCFEGLVEAVERHDGVVDKFIGDCLMAVFGVPVAHEDDAARAVRAYVLKKLWPATPPPGSSPDIDPDAGCRAAFHRTWMGSPRRGQTSRRGDERCFSRREAFRRDSPPDSEEISVRAGCGQPALHPGNDRLAAGDRLHLSVRSRLHRSRRSGRVA